MRGVRNGCMLGGYMKGVFKGCISESVCPTH